MRWLSPAIRRDRGWPCRAPPCYCRDPCATPAGNSARRRLFARRRDIPQPQHGIAVGAIDPLRTGIIVLRLRKLAGFQGVIPLLYQQPVAVSLQQAVPLAAVRAVRVHGNRFTELRHCPRAVAALGIGSPRAPTASLSRLSA